MKVKDILDVYDTNRDFEDQYIELYFDENDFIELKTSSKLLLICKDIENLEVESIDSKNRRCIRIYIKLGE